MSTTTTITAAEINKLRQTTGAGMMDCRKALVESDGDFIAAPSNLVIIAKLGSDSRKDGDVQPNFLHLRDVHS